MAGRTSYYGGIVLDGLIFHIDAAKQESYAKRGLRYMQAGNSNAFLDFADTSKSPSSANATGAIINGATFSNFSPYHLSDSTKPQYWHNPALSAWRDSAGIGTFYGNIEFDGVNDYVGFGSTPEMNGIKDITVSAWFYVNKFKSGAVPTGGTTSIIASRYNGVNGWALAYTNQGVVYFDGRESGAEYLSVTASITLKSSNSTANGGWYNAVGTKQGNVWSIYVAETNRYVVDGDRSVYVGPGQQSLLGTRTMGVGTTTFTTNNLYLGCVFDTPTLHMDGRLMSLSVYNRALSLSEINQNYDSFAKRIISSTVPSGVGTEFITVWDTSIPAWFDPDTPVFDKTIEIPINNSYNTYNYTVDWGDGNTTTGETGNAAHTYAVDGVYTVKISGTFPAIQTYSPYVVRMTEVSQWGANVWATMASAFRDCVNMNVTATDTPNLSIATNLNNMFFNCTSMNGAIGGWNTSTVTNMFNLFSGCSSFNQPLNSWNTSLVTNMIGMFQGCSVFDQPLNSWNTSEVLDMSSIFYGASVFNQPLNSWNTAKVTRMENMFRFASLFNQNIGSWNTAAVTNMITMFGNASAFNNGGQPMLTNGNSWNTTAVTDMSGMFYGASVFNQNIANWNTGAVTDMNSMFTYAFAFNNGGQPMLTNGNSWNTAAVTDMSGMFLEASTFNADISNWNTALVYNMNSMFAYATSFNQPLNSWNTISVTNTAAMFRNATSFNRPLNSWNTANVDYMESMFRDANVFNQNIASWNTAKVTNTAYMFSGAAVFNNGGQPMATSGNSWNTILVNNMAGMFAGASSFNQNITTWNTLGVISMRQMFYGAAVFNNGGQPMLTSGNSWNTSNVADMSFMFYAANVFNQNIANWNTTSVTDMSFMFGDAFAFNNGGQPIPRNVNSWNTALVTNMNSMFYNANAFNQNIGTWNVSNVLYFTNFMGTKNPANLSTANLDAIYNGWSTRPVKPSLIISFGTAKRTAASNTGRTTLTNSPNLWTITDGGI